MQTLASDDVRILTSAALRISNACVKLADASFGNLPGTDSPAAKAVASKYNRLNSWRGDAIIHGIHTDIYFDILAAAQHGQAFVLLARNSRDFNVALATMTRGAIEALARVRWLLDAKTPAELVTRTSNLALGDLAHAERLKTNVEMRMPDGSIESRDIVEYRESIGDYLLDHQLQRREPDKTELAVQLLQKSDPQSARNIYSGLSAAAHGEIFAIQNYSPIDAHARQIPDGELRLEMTDEMLVEYAWLLVASFDHVGDQLAQHFRPEQRHIDSWVSNRDASLLTLKTYGALRKDDLTQMN